MSENSPQLPSSSTASSDSSRANSTSSSDSPIAITQPALIPSNAQTAPTSDARHEKAPQPTHGISFTRACRVWFHIGILSFGGPIAQIAVMHRLVVDELKWISDRRFVHALNFCTLLPGPEAMQLATYLGWLLHRTRGGIIAGALFVLPGALFMLALSVLYVTIRDVATFAGALWGIKPVVLAIVVVSMTRLARRTLHGTASIVIALASLAMISVLHVPFPLIMLTAAGVGAALRLGSPKTAALDTTTNPLDRASLPPVDRAIESGGLPHTQTTLAKTIACLVLGACITLAPLGVLLVTLGHHSVMTQQTAFYSHAAVMTFGGAYAILTYVAQHIVHDKQWITTPEMMDGLGFAETTPGPLILVVQFTAFLTAHHHPESMHPIASGVIASLLTLWVTFSPSFVFILAGGPYVERLLTVRWLSGALAGITAAVVGVMANLALAFAAHTLFGGAREVSFGAASLAVPVWEQVSIAACLLAALSLAVMARFKRSTLIVLAGGAAIGVALRLGHLM